MAIQPTSSVSSAQAATALFGSAGDPFGGANAASILDGSASQSSRKTISLIVDGMQRQIDKLNGFKTDLTPAQKKKLAQNQAEIAKIEKKATVIKGLSVEDSTRRAELFKESYSILGKEYVDSSSNATLNRLTSQVDKLLEPKLRGAPLARLENLKKLAASAYAAINDNPENETARRNYANIKFQINSLTRPRKISQLSIPERNQYDELVGKVNEAAGTKFLLPSAERLRSERLQASKATFDAQLAAFGGDQFRPSPAAMMRAYSL